MAGGEDGVDRRFSILDCGFLIIPEVQAIDSAPKSRGIGGVLNAIRRSVECYRFQYNI